MFRPRRAALACLVTAWLLAAAAPVGVAASTGRFVDDDKSPRVRRSTAMAAAGIMKACNPPKNNRFCPKAEVERGQMAVFLAKAFKLTATGGRLQGRPAGHRAGDGDRQGRDGRHRHASARGRFCPKAHVSRGSYGLDLSRGLELTAPSGGHFTDVHASTAFATARSTASPRGRRDQLRQATGSARRAPITRAETAGSCNGPSAITRVTAQQPTPGNPAGTAAIPAGAGAVDTSAPDHVVGNGTPASCTSQAVVGAVAKGGVITFDCGPSPVTIKMSATAKVFNNRPNVVIDGGGLVTLDGRAPDGSCT